MILIRWLVNGIRGVIGLIIPFFAKDAWKAGSVLVWVARLLVFAAILIGLAYANHWLELERLVRAPVPILRHFWLPILFLLVYLLGWLGWWLWRLLDISDHQVNDPEIEIAWTRARRALQDAGIDLTQAPLFLVLGKPLQSEEVLFSSSGLSLKVNTASQYPGAPLHVFASNEAIFIACTDASLMGRHCQMLAERGSPWTAPLEGSTTARNSTSSLGKLPAEVTSTFGLRKDSATAVTEPTPVPRTTSVHRTSLLSVPADVEELSGRLESLCRRIALDRAPFCPLNGILLVIPYDATQSDDDARQTGTLCHRDLSLARSTLKVHCPLIVVICDLQKESGVREFLRRIPAELLPQRFGQAMPLVPDLEPMGLPAMVDSAVEWICQVLVRNSIFKAMYVSPTADAARGSSRGNGQLFEFLEQLLERQRRISRLIDRAAVSEIPPPLLLGGCFLVATGAEPALQAFLPGVMRLLIQNQNHVTWSQEAWSRDAQLRSWTTWGYAGLAALLLITIPLLAYFWPAT